MTSPISSSTRETEAMAHISELIDAYVRAVEAETTAYLAAAASDEEGKAERRPENKVLDAAASASTDLAIAAERALLSISKDEVYAETDSTGDFDYVQALALASKRWLVMNGSYFDKSEQTICRLVDMVLDQSRYDQVPLLWNIDGVTTATQPGDDVLHAGWDSQ